MNNYLQQCKTNPLIMMPPLGDVSTWLTHVACFVQRLFLLLRAVFGWTIMQLFFFFIITQRDAPLGAYSPPTASDLLENISARQVIMRIFMPTPKFRLSSWVKQWSRKYLQLIVVSLAKWETHIAVTWSSSKYKDIYSSSKTKYIHSVLILKFSSSLLKH